MNKIIILLIFCALIVCGISLLPSEVSYAQDQAKIRTELPEGKWTFSSRPVEQSQSDVEVYSVTSEADKGLAITKVGVRNRSDKVVGSLKIGWRLLDVSKKPSVLASEETPFLDITIAPGEWRVIDYPFGTFVNMSKSMLRDGKLSGDFRLEVLVTQVTYADTVNYVGLSSRTKPLLVSSQRDLDTPRRCEVQSNESATQHDGVIFVNASFKGNLVTSPPFCQNQDCAWNGQSGKAACFMCQGANFFGCQVTSCASCTSTRCQ